MEVALSMVIMRRWLVLLAGVVLLSAVALPAYAGKPGGGGSSTPSAYDISYPQCNHAFPSPVNAGIVGVNDGIVYSPNPCLGTGDGPSELAWAQNAVNHAPAFYANTADPGPAYSSHWPASTVTVNGVICDPGTDPNSTGCSYVYGWNAAQDSFNDAVVAEGEVNGSNGETTRAAAAPWWLDVETGNSWQTLESGYGNTAASQANDTAALHGAHDALASDGVTNLGFYSTSTQWTQITGTTGQFPANPTWLAGLSNASTAQKACGTAGFTGDTVHLAQYPVGHYDGDYAC